MKKRLISLLALFFVGQLFAASLPAYAKLADFSGPAARFGRGSTNLLTSPAEIVYQPMRMTEDNNSLVSIIGGIPLGVIHFPIRFIQGLYEVVTFPAVELDEDPLFIDSETLIEKFLKL